MSKQFWSVPPMWRGETVAIIGGGPTVDEEQIEYIRSTPYKKIVINNSYQLVPEAEILYFCDFRWYTWHFKSREFKDFKGIKITLSNNDKVPEEIHSLKNTGPTGLETDPKGLKTGSNSGYQCLNLCYHLKAKNVILLGYDMRVVDGKTHWHRDHRNPASHKIYKTNLIPKMDSIVGPLKEAKMNVLNCTPESALECFPKIVLGKERSHLK